jgi:hypothetical protein
MMTQQPASNGFFERLHLPGPAITLPVATLAVVVQVALLMSDRAVQSNMLHATLMSIVVLSTAFLGDENGKFDLRQPWSPLMVFHLPFWIIGTFLVVNDPVQQATWLPGSSDFIRQAMFLISIGFLAIGFGYRLGVRLRVSHLPGFSGPADWNTNRLIFLALLSYAMVWGARLFWYRQSLHLPFVDVIALGPPPSWIRTLGTTLPNFLMVAAWSMYYHNQKRELLALAWFLTLGDVFWGAIYGVMKSLLFLPFFLPVIPYIIQRGKIPVLRIVCGAAFLLLVIYPYVDLVRDEYFQPNGPDRREAIRTVIDAGIPVFSSLRERLSYYASKALDRVSGVGSISQILQLEEDNGLDINGAFYWRAVVGLVPRVLWPGKPIIHEGGYFSAYLDGQRGLDSIDLSTVYGSVAPTLFGSFYWNWGWPALIVSSLVIGLVSGIGYRLFKQAGLAHPSVFLFYAALLQVLDTTETEVAKLPSSLAWGFILAWGANQFLGASVGSDGSAKRFLPARESKSVLPTSPPQ